MIEVRETHKDAGVFEEGTVVPFQFEVANRGQADLEVTQVKPSCGCTVAKWDRVIKPGEHRTISRGDEHRLLPARRHQAPDGLQQ